MASDRIGRVPARYLILFRNYITGEEAHLEISRRDLMGVEVEDYATAQSEDKGQGWYVEEIFEQN